MNDKFLRTDETLEAVSALEMVATSLKKVENDWYQWKWAILAIHNSLQGFMVLALRGSNGFACLKDDIAKEWIRAYRANEKLPLEMLDTFLNLYKKIKNPKIMNIYHHSKTFTPTGTQGQSIKKLNKLRNDFVHFVPKGWSLEISGLPDIFKDCFGIIEFLGWESGNIYFLDDNVSNKAKMAIKESRESLESLQEIFHSKSENSS